MALDARIRIKHIKRAITVIFAWALFGMVLAAMFLIRADVSGRSMEPDLEDGDICVAVRTCAAKPSYGDIVLVQDPGRDRVLIKRVIAMGGDHVEISQDGRVMLNGAELNEPHARYGAGMSGSYDVPEGCVFILGDNRGDSADSRSASIGPVALDNIIGRVVMRILPADRFAIF